MQPHEISHASSQEHVQKQMIKCCFKNSKVDEKKKSQNPITIEHIEDEHRNENIDCRICLEPLRAGEIVAIPKDLPCGHFNFHSHCIVPWLLRNNSCPICRTVYVTTREDRRKQKRSRRWMLVQSRYAERNQLETCKYCEIHGLIFPDVCVEVAESKNPRSEP